jgi:ATP-dependent DNA helicase RecG
MGPEEVEEIIQKGEGQHTEFKTSFAEDNDAIKTLCAFANAEGGTVFFGISSNEEWKGVSLGCNTLENFANKLRRETAPSLSPSIEQVRFDGLIIVAVTVKKAERGQLYYAFGVPFIRVGKTNQVMSSDEQRARLLAGVDWRSEERDRPKFDCQLTATSRLETNFTPSFMIKQYAGDTIPQIRWRFRGPHFPMKWRQESLSPNTTASATFNMSNSLVGDNLVTENEIGLEIGFYWRGQWRSELHKWPITRKILPNKVHWDVCSYELLPPEYFDDIKE